MYIDIFSYSLGASLTTLREISLVEERKVVEVLVRKVPDDQQVSVYTISVRTYIYLYLHLCVLT